MLIIKKVVAFVILLTIFSLIGGSVFYVIYMRIFGNLYGSNRYFDNIRGVCIALIFVYFLNLLVCAILNLFKKNTVLIRSLSALLISVIIWIIINISTWGFDFKGTLMVLLSIGIPAFLLNFIMEQVIKSLEKAGNM